MSRALATALRHSLLILLLLSTSSFVTPVSATTIVVARTANEIVIGADSKVTDAFGTDLKKQRCKIAQVGNLFVAFEGFETDRRTGFNVQEIAVQALKLKAKATAAEKISILTGALVSRLFDELPSVQRNEPDAYRIKFAGGRVFLRVLVAGFERGQPLIFVRDFRAVQAGTNRIGITVLPDDCLANCQGGVVTRFLGETAAIEGLPEETSGFWQEGLIAGVRSLIETQIAARSEYVGPPIDILRITPRGAEWVQRKAECVSLQKPAKRLRR